MARRKNTKRIDPRYFLHETTLRDLNENEGYVAPPGLDDLLSRLTDPAQRQQVKTELHQSGVFQLDPIEDKEKIKSIINRMRGNSTDQVLDFILVTIADEVLKVSV
ncbi:MAG: hypothetical protein HN802_04075 [Candidatus Jacksonbacteria bacterium]|nr:hypothetical protein [Candidatus Jacksonbacteria bacterium]